MRQKAELVSPSRVRPALQVALLVLFAGIGAFLLIRSRAATRAVYTSEAEAGILSGAAAAWAFDAGSGPENGASGGSAVKLNAGTTGSPVIRAVNDHPLGYTTYITELMDLYADADIQAVRVDLPWHVLQPHAKRQWDPAKIALLDQYINGWHERGIKVLAIVLTSPQWARTSSNVLTLNFNENDYADYIEDLMVRYGDKIEAYEIWNEPSGSWGSLEQDPVRYTQILKAAYTRIKQVDPSRKVVGASLYGSGYENPGFLTTMYQQGAKDYFDILSIHNYGDTRANAQFYGQADWPVPYSIILDHMKNNIFNIMAAHGDTQKPIWFTETGASTATGDIGVSEADSAAALVDVYGQLKAGYIPNIERVYWYTMTSAPTSWNTPHEREHHFGLVEPKNDINSSPVELRRKPAYEAFKMQ